MNKKLLIIFFLGFSSGLPLALISSTLQAWFADVGVSVWLTATLSLIGLPYLYRFLWAPVLDRFCFLNMGKRRGWIFAMQISISVGLYAMTWLSPHHSPILLAGLAFLVATCSATQDAAIDAHRTEYLSQELYGIGASLATFAYRIALLISGGLALIIAQHFGWIITYRLMSGLMIVGMIAIYFSPEPSIPSTGKAFFSSLIDPLRELVSRSEIILFCCFIIFYKFGEAFTTSTSGIMMPFLIQGLHYSLDTIGYVTKIWGVIALVLGGLVGGGILIRFALYRALLIFGLFQAITNIIFIYLAASTQQQLLMLILAVISDNFVAGMGSTALVALFMRLVDQRFTATQFSIFVALSGLPRVFSGPIGAYLQNHFGWTGLYNIAFILSLGFAPFLYRLRHQRVFHVEKNANNQT